MTSPRELAYRWQPVDGARIASATRDAVLGWVAGRGESVHGVYYLFATSTDGVTWGRVDRRDGEWQLTTSDAVLPEVSPGLTGTLTELRVFTTDFGARGAELHAWRGGDGWRAVEIVDGEGEGRAAVMDESQLLFGTSVERLDGGFSVMREGQGLRHAVPLSVPPDRCDGTRRPLRLHVRHYVERGEHGWRIRGSRLAGLSLDWSKR